MQLMSQKFYILGICVRWIAKPIERKSWFCSRDAPSLLLSPPPGASGIAARLDDSSSFPMSGRSGRQAARNAREDAGAAAILGAAAAAAAAGVVQQHPQQQVAAAQHQGQDVQHAAAANVAADIANADVAANNDGQRNNTDGGAVRFSRNSHTSLFLSLFSQNIANNKMCR